MAYEAHKGNRLRLKPGVRLSVHAHDTGQPSLELADCPARGDGRMPSLHKSIPMNNTTNRLPQFTKELQVKNLRESSTSGRQFPGSWQRCELALALYGKIIRTDRRMKPDRQSRLGGGGGEPMDKWVVAEAVYRKTGDSKEAAPEGAAACVERITTRTHRRYSCCRLRLQNGPRLCRRLRPCCLPRFRRTPLRCRSFLHRPETDGGQSCGPGGSWMFRLRRRTEFEQLLS